MRYTLPRRHGIITPLPLLMLLLPLLLLQGCSLPPAISRHDGGTAATRSTPPPAVMTQQYDRAEARKKLVKGRNTIAGHAEARTDDGKVVTCAGHPVTLIPVTAYSRERMNILYGDDTSGVLPLGDGAPPRQKVTEDPAYLADQPQTYCNNSGDFTFRNLTDGDFYVTTGIVWTNARKKPQGVGLMQRVTVKGGKTQRVTLKN